MNKVSKGPEKQVVRQSDDSQKTEQGMDTKKKSKEESKRPSNWLAKREKNQKMPLRLQICCEAEGC